MAGAGNRTLKSYAAQGARLTRNSLVETWQRYRKLGWGGKLFIWFLIIVHVVIITLFVRLGPKKWFQTMYDLAQDIKHMRFGWLILGSIAVVTSFPPLLGYSTVMTLCGFAYGPFLGLAVAGTSAIIGSALTFIILRLLFKRRIKSWSSQNKRWQAMEAVIDARGLPLIIMIRLCPIPWVYSNALFASMESVALWQFVVATICLMPKLFLIIFVGSQVAKLSDGKTRGQMSTTIKILDVLSIVLSVALAAGVGWFVWRQTEVRIRHMQGAGLSEEVDREAADALDDATRPLLEQVLSSDSLVAGNGHDASGDEEGSALADVRSLDERERRGKGKGRGVDV